eukprot:c21257_g1_i3 orf=1-267(-)
MAGFKKDGSHITLCKTPAYTHTFFGFELYMYVSMYVSCAIAMAVGERRGRGLHSYSPPNYRDIVCMDICMYVSCAIVIAVGERRGIAVG